tara:strand:- start:10458 stop:12572 length:2115 start_codon:yes stop_codon:yes gene_type:complete
MSGFGAHYKGDVSEVTMGHETSVAIEHLQPRSWTAITDDSSREYTTIEFRGTVASGTTSIFEQTKPILKVPLGMLIGQKLTFHAIGTGNNNFSPFYNTTLKSRVYTIVDHTLGNNTDDSPVLSTKIKIVPAFDTTTSLSSGTGDSIFLHGIGLPTIQGDANSAMNAAAASSKEVSLVDQFVGLASFMTLPDTKVDLHSYHVVGLGRQVAVQQTGKVHHMGGSLEMPMHNANWLYYSLGREVVSKDACGNQFSGGSVIPSINTDISPGQGHIDVASSQATAIRFGGSTDAAVGDYILLKDTTLIPTTTYKTPNKFVGTHPKVFPHESSTSELASHTLAFEWAESSECRRISAIEYIKDLGSGTYRYVFRLYVDDGWQFPHTTSDTIELRRYNDSGTGPTINSNRTITHPVRRLLFSAETIPSFSLEHSVRTRDVGSYNATGESTTAPDAANDSNQLTRVFKGCKVVEWEMSSTVDAELKYRCVFNALACYTDTGRLESSNKGDRYTAHRMFQNTASTKTGRKASGIAEGSEKPFMFYNGTVSAFNQDLTFISAFELRGKTGVEMFHTIQSNPVPETVNTDNISLKQIPYGGTRNASIIREGREEFEMEIVIALENQSLFHELRSQNERGGTVGLAGGTIMLHFTKPTTSLPPTDGTAQSLRVIIDDYYITELPIPVPDDKGLLITTMKIKPQNVKVISEDTVYHC